MKWFEHETDAHSHPKWKRIIKEFGAEGYYVGFATLEIIGKYGGVGLRLSLDKYPVSGWAEDFGVKEETIVRIWKRMAEMELLSNKLLKENVLYSRKLRERCDEYHKKLQTKSRQYRDIIGVDKNTLDKIRKEYITVKGYKEENLNSDDYARIHKAIKDLLAKAKGNVDMAIGAIHWTAKQGYEWTMETVVKKYLDYITTTEAKERLKELYERIGKPIPT